MMPLKYNSIGHKSLTESLREPFAYVVAHQGWRPPQAGILKDSGKPGVRFKFKVCLFCPVCLSFFETCCPKYLKFMVLVGAL